MPARAAAARKPASAPLSTTAATTTQCPPPPNDSTSTGPSAAKPIGVDPRRTVAQMAAARIAKGLELPLSLPTGPWVTDQEALVAVGKWASSIADEGGAWAVNWGSRSKANSARGDQHTMICHQHKAQSCKWTLTVEHCQEGWSVFYIHNHCEGIVHSHPLVLTDAQRMAFPGLRKDPVSRSSIPTHLLEMAKTMKASGSSVKNVFNWLQHMVQAEGDTPMFNYQDVYHAVAASTQQRTLDATNFVASLLAREKEFGLKFFTQEDEDGCLKSACWEMKGAMDIYSRDPEGMQVLFDTKARRLL